AVLVVDDQDDVADERIEPLDDRVLQEGFEFQIGRIGSNRKAHGAQLMRVPFAEGRRLRVGADQLIHTQLRCSCGRERELRGRENYLVRMFSLIPPVSTLTPGMAG